MGRVSFISHQNRQILLIDAKNCSARELLRVALQIKEAVTHQPRNSVLTLSDFAGAKFTHQAITRLKEVAAYDHPFVRRAAIVNAASMPQVLLDSLKTFAQRDFAKFDTREEALEWLVAEP